MKISEIRKLKAPELTVQSNNLRQEIIDLRRGIVLGESTSVRAIRNKKKDLARTLTVLSEQLSKENM